MKVCHITSVHSYDDTRIFIKECVSLSRVYEVHLIAPGAPSQLINNVYVHGVEKDVSGKKIKRMTKTVNKVYKKALEIDAAVYHFHDPELIPVGLLLKRKGKKVVYDIHENVSKQIKSKDWIPLNKTVSRLFRFMELLICRNFALVLAENSYNKYYPAKWNKITVLNLPALDTFPSVTAHKEYDIVYLGGVTKVRCIEETLDALSILKKNGQALNFHCIGPVEAKYLSFLEKKVEELDLIENVTFYGRLNAIEAYKIVAKAKIGLAVLKPIPNYFESLSTKIFEYMAMEIPVITSDFPIYKEIINESKAGLNINPNSKDELANAILTIIENPELAMSMGVNGRRIVENKYNWETESEKLLALYDNLLKDNTMKVEE